MPDLYIANLTKQHQDFIFLEPGSQNSLSPPRHRTQRIGIGEQALIHKRKMTHEEIDEIVKQHEAYGLVNFKDIDNKEFRGLCYSIDRPIPVEKILDGIEMNENQREEISKRVRRESAAALSEHINGDDSSKSELNSLQVEVREETERGISPKVDETISVDQKNSGKRRR